MMKKTWPLGSTITAIAALTLGGCARAPEASRFVPATTSDSPRSEWSEPTRGDRALDVQKIPTH